MDKFEEALLDLEAAVVDLSRAMARVDGARRRVEDLSAQAGDWPLAVLKETAESLGRLRLVVAGFCHRHGG